MAEAGVIGATRIVEGKNGFLKAYSPNPHKSLDRLVRDIGSEWIWLNSALKPFPACRMTHTIIELAGSTHTAFAKKNGRPLAPEDIQRVTLFIPASNFILVGDPTPNKIHPINVIDGQFSAYFQTANALLYGANTGLKAYGRLSDSAIQALCDKITVIADPDAVRGFPGRMRVLWEDGVEEEKYQEFALGEVQHPFTRDRVEEKFASLAVPVYGESKTKQILGVIDDLEGREVDELIQLLR
jgi:2-methylcitrate dehydratase PrpD